MAQFQDCSHSGPMDELVRHAMADFITQMSVYVQVLCGNVFAQAGTDRFRFLLCLQAQTLELQQLRMQLGDVASQASSFAYHVNVLQDACRLRDEAIHSLNEELRGVSSDLTAVKEADKECMERLQQDLDHANVLLQDQRQQLDQLGADKADLQMEVAHLKQSVHLGQVVDSVDRCISDSVSDTSCTASDGTGSILFDRVVSSYPLPVMSASTHSWILHPPAPDG